MSDDTAPLGHDWSSVFGGHGSGGRVVGQEIIVQLVLGGAVFAVVVGLLVLILLRRAIPPDEVPEPPPEDEQGHRWIWLGGVVLPLVVISGVALAEARSLHLTSSDAQGMHGRAMGAMVAGAQNIEVVGHRWWWEVRYPGSPPVVTANELVLPTGQPVHVRLRTHDVQHSFWIPGLDRKMDMVPGRVTFLDVTAQDPGRYLGECMELCGLEHAYMRFQAVAVTPAAFTAWLTRTRRAARTPRGRLQQEGERVLLRSTCAACHTIAGTPAQGDVGPELTHLASRPTLAAGRLPNTAAALARWIRDPQAVKPGVNMPASPLPRDELRALVAYLRALR